MILNIAICLKDAYYKLIAVGLGTLVTFQVFLSIGGVIKFIPSTGVTLPFISYGGSSIVFLMAEMGLALSVSNQITYEK